VGVYTASRVLALGLKFPAPPPQTPLVVPPLTSPPRATSGDAAQRVWASPASTSTASLNVIVTVSLTSIQGPSPSGSALVRVRINAPGRTSAVVGVYTASRVLASGLK